MSLDMFVRSTGCPRCARDLKKTKLDKKSRAVKIVLAIWIEADDILANSEAKRIGTERRAILRMHEGIGSRSNQES